MAIIKIARSRRINVSNILQKYDAFIKNSYGEKEKYIKKAKNEIIRELISDESKKIEGLSIGRMAAKRQIEEIKNWINSFEDLEDFNNSFNRWIKELIFEVTNQFEIGDDMKRGSDSHEKKGSKSSSKKQVWITEGIVDKLNKLKENITTICNGTQGRPGRTESQKLDGLSDVKSKVIEGLILNERRKTRELFLCRIAVNKELDKMKEEINNLKSIEQIRNYCNDKIEQLLKHSMHRESKEREFVNTPPLVTHQQFSMNFQREKSTVTDENISNELKKFIDIPKELQEYEIDGKRFKGRSVKINIPKGNGEIFTAGRFVLCKVDVEPGNEWKGKLEGQITRVEADKYRQYMPSPKDICEALSAIKCYIKNRDGTIIDDDIDYENDLRKFGPKTIAGEYLKERLSLDGIYFINGGNGKRKTLQSYDDDFSFSNFTGIRTRTPIDEIEHLAIFVLPKPKKD